MVGEQVPCLLVCCWIQLWGVSCYTLLHQQTAASRPKVAVRTGATQSALRYSQLCANDQVEAAAGAHFLRTCFRHVRTAYHISPIILLRQAHDQLGHYGQRRTLVVEPSQNGFRNQCLLQQPPVYAI